VAARRANGLCPFNSVAGDIWKTRRPVQKARGIAVNNLMAGAIPQ
jgi:hypothetical protein